MIVVYNIVGLDGRMYMGVESTVVTKQHRSEDSLLRRNLFAFQFSVGFRPPRQSIEGGQVASSDNV